MSHFRKLTIKDIRKETGDCVSFSFEIPVEWQAEFRFREGQNITIRTHVGGEEIRRSYSICSSPQDGELRVAVKRVGGGRFSSYANEHLQKGDRLDVLPPSGTFYTDLHPRHQKKYLAFAAGSGITPILSIIRTVLATEPGSHFTLVYGNRDRQSIIFKEALEGLKDLYMDRFALHHILSREKRDTPFGRGRIGPEKCKELSEKLIHFRETDEVFLCGPQEMIFSVKSWLEQEGLEARRIHFELFNTPVQTPALPKRTGPGDNAPTSQKSGDPAKKKGDPADPADRKAVPAAAEKKEMISQVTIRLDGSSTEFTLPYEGEAILDAALLEGIDLPYACKGGVCCTCRAKLIEGEVYMDSNYALEADELAAGFVLTCQSHPRSEKVMLDFDSK